jgi:hypothetical protein
MHNKPTALLAQESVYNNTQLAACGMLIKRLKMGLGAGKLCDLNLT